MKNLKKTVASYPHLVKEWHPKKNGTFTPGDVSTRNDTDTFWWVCSEGHEWLATARSRAKRGSGCPECKSLAFLYPEIAKEWHPTKNETPTPGKIAAGSGKKVWWKCSKGHEWEAKVNSRTRGSGCPKCKSLAFLHPEIAKEWHPTKNETPTPGKIAAGSDKKVWWKCSKDGTHVWEAKVNSRTGQGTGCPKCPRKVDIKDSIADLHPEIAKEWHPIKNGTLRPEDVTPGSHKGIWWKCSKGHEWEAAVADRVGKGSSRSLNS